MLDTSEEALKSKWEEFFHDYGYDKRIEAVSDSYPDIRSVKVSYSDINRYDFEFLEYLLEQPARSLRIGEDAMRDLRPPGSEAVIHLRVEKLPKESRIEIRNLRSNHMGKFISVEGLVRKVTEVRPMLINAMYKCERCGATISVPQDGRTHKDPMECSKDAGGCGLKAGATRFKLLENLSEFVDTQKIEVQEKPEGLRGGAQPQRLTAWADDDIAGIISPGDRVIINGILRNYQKNPRFQVKSNILEIFLEVNNIELEQQEFEEIEIEDEDIAQIKELAESGQIRTILKRSIAPTIYGMDHEKEALILQLFGGVPKTMADGTTIRGDIHILMVGDPGTAKSQLLRYIGRLAPRGIYTSGKSASAAGLTAAAVKDDFGEGRWTLEAGTLVLADLGIASIDELDKMTPQDRSAMHEAMEQQTVTVAKAGINATLQSRCAILGAANPRDGRFDKFHSIPDQIDMPATLISRFDVIFVVRDEPDERKDRDIADHILKVHYVGGMDRQAEKGITDEGSDEEKEGLDDAIEAIGPEISKDLLKKYIAYARTSIFPVLSKEAQDALRSYYLSIRKQGEGEGSPVPITARQLEAMVRMAEASARLRLNQIVTADDAERAIAVEKYYLDTVAGVEGGGFDIDMISTGISMSQRDEIRLIRDIMRDLAEETEKVEAESILEEAEGQGISREKAKEYLRRLKQQGEIFNPDGRGKYYRFT